MQYIEVLAIPLWRRQCKDTETVYENKFITSASTFRQITTLGILPIRLGRNRNTFSSMFRIARLPIRKYACRVYNGCTNLPAHCRLRHSNSWAHICCAGQDN